MAVADTHCRRFPRRVLRVAHLTDIHVQPELGAAVGMEKCLEHAQSQNPDLIINGGDMVMDSLGADSGRMRAQWDVFQRVLRSNISTPIRHCLGNHDVWGWNNYSAYQNEAQFGKKFAQDRLEMDHPYYSFGEGGWHFIVLDSTHRKRGPGYTAKLNEEQFEWLQDDLKRTPDQKPICVISHIPVLSACAYFDGDNERMGNWMVPGAWMHTDARRIKDLFRNYSNVKLCISGHIHLVDQVKYLGITYLCNGAACGGWWRGPYQETHNGYALIDLYSDGTFRNHYVEYGWKSTAA